MGEVPGIVLRRVNRRNFALPVNITKDSTGNIWQFRDPKRFESIERIGKKHKDTDKSIQSSKT